MRPDPNSITALYRRFEKAHAAMKSLPGDRDSRAFDRAVEKCSGIADRIVRAQSRDIDEMLTKIRIVGWCALLRRTSVLGISTTGNRAGFATTRNTTRWCRCALICAAFTQTPDRARVIRTTPEGGGVTVYPRRSRLILRGPCVAKAARARLTISVG